MSAKWRRIQAWDAEHLTGWLTPVRIVMDWLSSIRLAVILLVFVALYAVLASVPIGLLALAPTYLVYAITVALAACIPAAVGALIIRAAMQSAGRAPRFIATFVVILALAVAGAWAWRTFAWPTLKYDPTDQTGLRFFAGFVDRYDAVTVRRLPILEMTELEFYAWWPLTGTLLLFCANLIVATIRRIEFTFKNLGVLTVHTGIITMALGSLMYGRFKVEGDTILLAAPPIEGAGPQAGPGQSMFYDNTRVVLNVAQHTGIGGRPQWEQRVIAGLPRYNVYGIDQATDAELLSSLERTDTPESLPLAIDTPPGDGRYVDPDLEFRIVGYAPQVELVSDWARAEPPADTDPNPLRELELYAELPPEAGTSVDPTRPAFRFTLMPAQPARRVSDNAMLGIEYTTGMDEARWNALTTPLPRPMMHALVVQIPGADPVVLDAVPGTRHDIPGANVAITTTQLHPTPPFPIITPGYENASSPVAIITIEPLDEHSDAEPFERWLYYRFPAIDQDIAGTQADGRPNRGPADRDLIDVTYLDASRLQIHMDERPDGTVRSIIRQPRGAVRVEPDLTNDRLEDVIPGIDIALARQWDHARLVRAPRVLAPEEQNAQDLGTHAGSALAVEISSPARGDWKIVEWVPFSRYLGVGDEDAQREVTLPDGRTIRVAFGRQQHRLPGFRVRMIDFEMIAYDHRGAPRDYQSVVRVEPTEQNDDGPDFDPFDHTVKLNAPLRAPFHWDPESPWITNTARRIGAGFNPNQFKFSQAGWDQQGWQQTQQMVDAGELDRPFARYTILGVGNNPGIHVIALGGILMSVGTPWAFYVKPWLVRRERDRLKRAHAASPKEAAA